MQSFEVNIFLFSQIFWLALCQTEWITVNEAIFGKRSRAAAFVDPVTAPLTPNQTIQTRDGHHIVEPSFDNVCIHIHVCVLGKYRIMFSNKEWTDFFSAGVKSPESPSPQTKFSFLVQTFISRSILTKRFGL